MPRRQYPDGYVADVQGGAVVSKPGTQILKIARRSGRDGRRRQRAARSVNVAAIAPLLRGRAAAAA